MPNEGEIRPGYEFPADNEFWQYSLRVYALPGVADLCLLWQEQYGINVNILLWSAWLEHEGVQVTDALLDEVIAGADPWGEKVIVTIRNLRRDLKKRDLGPVGIPKSLSSMRESLLKTELKAEQCLQSWLYGVAVEFLSAPESIHETQIPHGANIDLYLRATIGDKTNIAPMIQQWLELSGEQNPAKPT